MRWVIQNNLVNVGDHDRMVKACEDLGYKHESITVIPFQPDLPDIPSDMPTVFYGGTNFIKLVHDSGRWTPGAFFGDSFSMRSYVQHYGADMLCHPCTFTTLREFAASHRDPSELFFVKPNLDLKEFAGEVMEFNSVVTWERNLRHELPCSKHPGLTADTEIMVSTPYGIAHEWRLFMVRGRVSSGSHYRAYRDLEVYPDVPQKVIERAEELCHRWTPADVFVLDIGESSGNLYVIECNCFNSAGFYASDVEKVMRDINAIVSG